MVMDDCITEHEEKSIYYFARSMESSHESHRNYMASVNGVLPQSQSVVIQRGAIAILA